MWFYRKAKGILFSIIITGVALIGGCQKPSQETSPSKLTVSLIDSPGDFDKVYVEILKIQVKFGTSDWTDLTDFVPGTYNILDYTSGKELLITSQELKPTLISNLQIFIGTNNSLLIQGDSIPLYIPAGQESGTLVGLNQMLDAGQEDHLLIDFDVARSVLYSGSTGLYFLRPVISAFIKSKSGAISGKVFPDSLNVAIQVNSNGNVVASSYAPKGVSEFVVAGLPDGVYMAIFDPGSKSGFQQYTTQENIVVRQGQTTDIGSITLVK